MKSQLIAIVAAVLMVGCGKPFISIHDAAANGNTEAVKRHLDAGTDVNIQSQYGTPLIYASQNGHKKVAELLISRGANVNAKSEDGLWTALHHATGHSTKEMVQLLIKNKADVNAKNKNGETPLDIANGELAELLQKHGGKHGTINGASRRGNIEAVKQFLADGADVNAKADDEWTPLHNAAGWGHKEVVELLIAEGADVNVKDGDGETPLDWANRYNHPETADLLRKHGGKTAKELKAEGK
jgi:ankyrin repeat protein